MNQTHYFIKSSKFLSLKEVTLPELKLRETITVILLKMQMWFILKQKLVSSLYLHHRI